MLADKTLDKIDLIMYSRIHDDISAGLTFIQEDGRRHEIEEVKLGVIK